MRLFLSLLLAIITGISPVISVAQTAASQQDEEVVRFRTNEVKLDVVVKDKKGRPIKDLTANDFQILEDGVPQKVESFRFLNRETAQSSEPATKPKGSTEPSPANPPVPPRSQPAVTALVFDRLSQEARSLARKAGLAYAQEGTTAGDYTGVFSIDQSLRTLQPFTDNSELVKSAVEAATGSANSSYVSSASKIRDNAERSIALDQQSTASTQAASAAGAAHDSAGASAAGAAAGQAMAEQKFLEMQSQMLDHFERLERDQQGFATINSLLAVISPMQNLPGRKTIIFFSEGLKMPPAVQAKFPAVVNAANRANVSIYTIDAGGLRIESNTIEAAKELNSLAAGRLQQQSRAGDSTVNGPYTRSLERNEELLKFDPRSGLGELADETGGFLIHDTNDLVAGLRRIDDDMHAYYLLTYIPENKDYDGRFRQINVKINRSNVEIQSRKGYYALESVGNFPTLDYEAPALAAARKFQAGANPIQLRGAALTYPSPGRAGLVLLMAETPLSAFKFAPSSDNKAYNADLSILALVKDNSGQVVQKLSQHYPMTGPLEGLESARKGELLFYREAQLAAGKYKVELIAYDATAKSVNVRTTALEVPATDDTKPRVSSVSILKRAERLSAEEQKRDQPFHFGELLVYPNLGEPINPATAKQLAFFFTAWPAKGASAPLQLTLQILQNKQPLGQTSAALPQADAQGQIKYASAIPLDKFKPGVFELKVTVSDGKNSVSQSAVFTVGS